MPVDLNRHNAYARVISFIGTFKLVGSFDEPAGHKFWDDIPFDRAVKVPFDFNIATTQCTNWWNANHDANWYGHVVNDADHDTHGGIVIDNQYRDYITATYNAVTARLVLPVSPAEKHETYLRDYIGPRAQQVIFQMIDHDASASVLVQVFERAQGKEHIVAEQFLNSSTPGPFGTNVRII